MMRLDLLIVDFVECVNYFGWVDALFFLFVINLFSSLNPKPQPYVITEENDGRGVGRFQIKVYPSGVTSFQNQYYFELKKRRLEIGKYPLWSLADARKKFFEYSAMVEQGGNPTAEKDQAAAERKKEQALASMGDLISEFLLFADENWAPNTTKRLGYCFSHDLTPLTLQTPWPLKLSQYTKKVVID